MQWSREASDLSASRANAGAEARVNRPRCGLDRRYISGRGNLRLGVSAMASLCLQLLDLTGEIFGRGVDRGNHVGRRLGRPQGCPLEPQRCLDNLRIGNPRIAVLGELNLELGKR